MAVATVAYDSPLNIDPSSFDASVTSLLISMGGEKYIDIFRSRNISQETLMELTNEDLRKLGVDNEKIRAGIIAEVQNFPIYDLVLQKKKMMSDLDLEEIAIMLRDSNQHLHRLHLSMISINLALKRRHLVECIVEEKPMTYILKKTLDEITKTLNRTDKIMNKNFKSLYRNEEDRMFKKVMVGTLGTAVVAALSVFFVQSLRDIK